MRCLTILSVLFLFGCLTGCCLHVDSLVAYHSHPGEPSVIVDVEPVKPDVIVEVEP